MLVARASLLLLLGGASFAGAEDRACRRRGSKLRRCHEERPRPIDLCAKEAAAFTADEDNAKDEGHTNVAALKHTADE